ncbi:MAG TPA: 2-oxo acid dehydrogenase subunit E2 [Planctomycetota bacterium]|jgi:pyruvate dehydrogenase E2 component (dihydrolipoamide acetyltransferase)
MHTIKMPQASKTMRDGTIKRWLKKEGDRVEKGEVVLEIESQEGLIQAEASVSGIVRQILVPAGKTAKVDAQLAMIEEPGLAQPAPQPQIQNPQSKIQNQSAPTGSVVAILMPQAGQSMEEGTILKWRVKPGDPIKKGQIIFDVETDKATVEVEAIDEGRLARIVCAEGQTLAVKLPVAFLADNDAAVDAFIAAGGVLATPAAAQSEAVPVVPSPLAGEGRHERSECGVRGEGGRVKASPAARKIAKEKGIDLAGVGAGSGPGGRILSTDLANAKPGASRAQAPGVVDAKGCVRRKMSKMRRAIANNLLASKQNIPHFYARLTIDAGPLMAFYKEQKPKTGCSVNDVVTLGVAKAMKEFPQFRSQIDKEEMVEFPHANIGIAVGVEDGLVVPVVSVADTLPLTELAKETRRVVDAARAGKLERTPGNLTITNLGMFGVEEFAAIINPPEPAILAVGAVRETVIVKDGAMRAGRVMTMTLSSDHRIIDGVLAAKFLARLKELLENPANI